MAGLQSEPTRIVTVTDSWALPQSDLERKTAWQAVIGALRGSWGTGPWDAGLGGEGTWSKYQQYWDATVVVDLPAGGSTVVLPFKAKDTVVLAYPATPGVVTPVSYYVQTGTSFGTTLVGTHVLKVHMSKATK